ncbi:hypothetical protein B0H11DRAFT_2230060 [Mycena galericulata]|nr:hypothetical protein B0H11DRAFT_2230060 [Mycena galericulata]
MPPPIDTGVPNTDASDAYVEAAAALELAQRALSTLKEAASRDLGEINELRRGTEDAAKERDLARSVAEAKVREVAVLKEVHERIRAELDASVSHERERLNKEREDLSQDRAQLKAERTAFEAEKKALLDEPFYTHDLDFIRFALDFKRSAFDLDHFTPKPVLQPPRYRSVGFSVYIPNESPRKRRKVELAAELPLQRHDTRAIIAASADDVKVERQIAPIRGGAPAVRTPPAPITRLPEEAHLLALIAKVSSDTSEAPDLLKRLQSLATLVADRHPTKIQVFDQPIMFVTGQSKNHRSGGLVKTTRQARIDAHWRGTDAALTRR